MPSTREPFNVNRNCSTIFVAEQNARWREVLHLGKRIILEKNAIIPSGNGKFFYFINKGSVRLERIGYDGEEGLILFLRNGQIFNEVPAILHPNFERKHCEVQFCAVKKSDIYSFNASLLYDKFFLSQYPWLIYNILQSVAYKSFTFLYSSTDKKFIKSIGCTCKIIYKMYIDSGCKTVIEPDISQHDLSMLIGISRTTLYRVLKYLRANNIIGRFSKKYLEIFDVNRLMNSS
ncbi:MAG: Crp/Fnr family transcriptional regulator [Desulfovibrio sp.]|jgi:CRP-like cAMP-binding protein|nr:Crp/Fnr family transcriptional regulator [Desulfovibrio sp.]